MPKEFCLEVKGGAARFRPIREFSSTVALAAAGGVLALLSLRTVSGMLRR